MTVVTADISSSYSKHFTPCERLIIEVMKQLAMKVLILDLVQALPYKNQTLRYNLARLIRKGIVQREPHTRPGRYKLVGFPYHGWKPFVGSPADGDGRLQLLLNLTGSLDECVKLVQRLGERAVSVLQWRGKVTGLYDEGWMSAVGFEKKRWGSYWQWVRLFTFPWGRVEVCVFRNLTYTVQASFNQPQRLGSETLKEFLLQVSDVLDFATRRSRRDEKPVRAEITLDESGGPLWDYLSREGITFIQVYRRKEKARRGVHFDVVFDNVVERPSLSRWMAGDIYL